MRSRHLVAVAVTAVGAAAATTVWAASAGEHPSAASAPLATAPAGPSLPAGATTTATARHRPAASPHTRARPSPTPSAVARAVPVAAPVTVRTASHAPAPAVPRAAPSDAIAAAVFDQLNSERAQVGRPPLAWSPALASSATSHNRLMDENNTLSHQFPGEGDLQSRVTAAGFTGSTYGENIGEIPQTDQAGALALQQFMFDEKAPSDGHRLNIVSSSYRDVGISVIIDQGTGELWLTEDFGG